jgi:transposase
LGHDVRLLLPIYVKPCVKRGKSDAIDVEAICEAVTRLTISDPARDACIAERSLCCN